MQRSDKTIISASTLLTCLAFYSYAKAAGKEVTPYTMIGAFVGTLIGESIADYIDTYKPSINGHTDIQRPKCNTNSKR